MSYRDDNECTLYLVRHGQTEANLRMALDAAPPGGPLTEEGRKQATELARALAATPLVAVYASTALRARQTAEPVASDHGLDVELMTDVREVDVGELEGRSDHESLVRFRAVYEAWVNGDIDRPMPAGETGRQVLARYTAAVDGIREKHPQGSVVLVSHGAVMRLAAARLADNVGPVLGDRALMPNTGRVVLRSTPDGVDGGRHPWHCIEWMGVALPE